MILGETVLCDFCPGECKDQNSKLEILNDRWENGTCTRFVNNNGFSQVIATVRGASLSKQAL
jgi:hypothetical protein